MSIWLDNLIRRRRQKGKVNNLIDVLLNNPVITFEAMKENSSTYTQLAGTIQEEDDKQQERKRKLHLAGQMALEELRHKENGPYFSDILKEMQELYDRKNHDYGNSFSETIQEFGFTPAIARINDKFKRVKQMVKGEQMQVNESMRDNLIDIANYCILTIIELDKCK